MAELRDQLSKLSADQRKLLMMRIKKRRQQEASNTGQTIPSQSRESNVFPLSFAQQRIWFLEQYEHESVEYNISMFFSLEGQLNESALERSLDEIVSRHEILRTNFEIREGDPVQVIATPSPSVPLKKIELKQPDAESQAAELKKLAIEESNTPFDLTRSPLLRAVLVHSGVRNHVLFLSVHHIAFDGWSKKVFFGELSALYEAFCNDEPAQLPDLPIQYADFSFWQSQLLNENQLAGQLDYWKGRLADAPPLVSFPADKPRDLSKKAIVSAETFSIDPVLAEKLQQLCRQHNSTLFTTVFAAFSVLLSRYSGSQDMVIGLPMADRGHRETEDLVGLFLNTIALRVDLSAEPSFHELLDQVKQVSQEALENQDIPFQKLVEELHPQRNLQYTPVFQVMFNLQKASKKGFELTGLEVTPLRFKKSVPGTNYDLTFSVEEKQNEITGVVEYKSDLYTRSTICRMIENFKVLLESAVTSPDQPVSMLRFLAAPERERLLLEWNRTDAHYAPGLCMHELFESQVEKTPESIAAVFREEKLSYQELNQRANRLAYHLLDLGLHSGALVGIYMERSLDMLAAMIGVLKAGYAYLPLDPTYPADRLAFMVEDAKTGAILTQKLLLDSPLGQHENLVFVDEEAPSAHAESTENPARSVGPDDLAYVIYTSGSTGKPQGVQLPHKAVVNFLHSMRREPGIAGDDTLYSVTTLSFDISVLELFVPIVTGARVVIADSEVVYDGKKLLAEIKASEATVMQATPATWRLLLDAGWQERLPLKILSGGEALPPHLASLLIDKGESLWNLYGPTEATIWSTVFRVDTDDNASSEQSIPIGRPIANTRTYILDANLQPTPVGVPGDLYIGGAGLAVGYLNRPRVTDARFLHDPFRDDGSRIYNTGDLARYLPDGCIEYITRTDNQVKVRGFRIELGEIETVMCQHDAIDECVAMVYDDTQGNKNIGVYFKSESSFSTLALRNHLRKKLPNYMIPAAFTRLEAFPLTPNGKIDHKALAAFSTGNTDREKGVSPPSTPAQKTIAETWQTLLGVDQVSLDDNFFDVGGHSLLVMQVIASIEEKLRVTVPVKDFFYQTLGQIAAYCEGTQVT